MTSRLYYGDNVDVLRAHIADASVDLIYLDPPFNSNGGIMFVDAVERSPLRDTGLPQRLATRHLSNPDGPQGLANSAGQGEAKDTANEKRTVPTDAMETTFF